VISRLLFGPFEKPLSVDLRSRVDTFIGRAQSKGYSLIVNETDESVSVVAVEIKEPKLALLSA